MRTVAILGVSCLFGLAGCGLTGDLERPDPLWGNTEKTDVEAAVPIEDNTVRIGEGTSVFDTENELLDEPEAVPDTPDETSEE